MSKPSSLNLKYLEPTALYPNPEPTLYGLYTRFDPEFYQDLPIKPLDPSWIASSRSTRF